MVKDKESALRYNNILEDLIKGIMSGAEISRLRHVSAPYVSQIKKDLESLTIKPLIEDDILICTQCKLRGERFLKIRNINGEIKILCHICYRENKNKFGENNNNTDLLKKGLIEYNELMSIIKPSKTQLSKVDMNIIKKATKEALK